MAVTLTDKKSVFCIVFALLAVLLFSFSPVHALKISSITFNVTNSTYGHYNIITLKVVGNQSSYDVSIYNFNVSAFDGTSFLNRTKIANDTLTRINITRRIGAGNYYNLTLNISNSTEAGTAVKYNLTSPCDTSTIHCFFKVSKATLAQALSSSPASSFTYDGKTPTITDTLTASSGVIVSGQSGLGFTLYNSSVSTGSTGSSTLSSNSFVFSALAGKYAAAGSYDYKAESAGNSNYTVTTSPTLLVTIAKGTHLLLSINGAVDSNASITYGTASNFTAFFEQNQNYTSPVNESIVGNITAGNSPIGIAYDSENNLVYVANEFSNDVYVINPLTQAVVANISGIQYPYAVGYDSANNLIYVTEDESNITDVINPVTQTVIHTIKVGGGPLGIAYDSKNNLMYVSNYVSNTVSVINPATQTVIENVSVGSGPRGIAYDSKNNLLYVANDNSNTVSVINASDESVISISSKCTTPAAATYDSVNNLIFIGCANTETVFEISPAAQNSTEIFESSLSTLNGLGYDSFNNVVYITLNNGQVILLNPINKSAFKYIKSGDDPSFVGYDSENNLIFISNYGSHSVSVINPSYELQIYVNSSLKDTTEYKSAGYASVLSAGTYKVTAVSNANKTNVTYYETIAKGTHLLLSINGAVDSNASITYGTASNFTAFFEQNQNYTSPVNESIVGNITAGNSPIGIAYDSENNLVYVANEFSNDVYVINPLTQAVVANISGIQRPYAVGYDSANNLIYVTELQLNSTAVINPVTQTVIHTIKVGANPFGIAYDSKNNLIYVSNYGSSTVSVINPATQTVIENVSVGSEPRGIAYDSKNNLLYVANENSTTVSVINASDESVTSISSPCITPAAATYDSVNNLIYIGCAEPDTVFAISPAAQNSTTVFDNPGYYLEGLGYDSFNNVVYITRGTGPIILLNPINKSAFKYIQLGNTPSFVGYDSENNLIFISNYGSHSVSVINPSYELQIYVNSSLKDTTEYKSAGYASVLSAGTYKVTAVSNANKTNVTYYEKINKATPVITLTSAPSGNFTQNGTSLIFHFSVSSLDNQVLGNFYVNGTLKNSSITTSGVYNASNLPGVFVGVFNTSGGQNYTLASINLSEQIYKKISGGSGIPIFPRLLNRISLGISRYDATINYLSIAPSVYMASSDFNNINISFTPSASNISFSLNMEVNPNSSQCSISGVKDPIQGINLLPSISENGMINGAYFTFLIKLDSQGMIPNYNISPYDVVLYKCDEQNSSWVELPTNTSISQTGFAVYSANSDSLSDYEIGAFAPAKQNIINTTISESGLPSGYAWNATYDGMTKSIVTPDNITFSTAPGNYSFTAYNLTPIYSHPNMECGLTYYPTNFKAGVPQSIAAGSQVLVVYAPDGTACSSAPIISATESYYIYVIVIIVAIAAAYAIKKKLQRNKGNQKKKRHNK